MFKTLLTIVTFTTILVPLPLYGEVSLVDLATREVRGNTAFDKEALVALVTLGGLVIETKCDASSKGEGVQTLRDLAALAATDTSLSEDEKAKAEAMSKAENVNGSQTAETLPAGPTTTGEATPLQSLANSPTNLNLSETENKLNDGVGTQNGLSAAQQSSASNDQTTTTAADTAAETASNTKLQEIKVQASAGIAKVIQTIKRIALSVYKWCRELGRKFVGLIYGVIHRDYLERLARDQYKQVLLQFANDMDAQAFKIFVGAIFLDPTFAIGLSTETFTSCISSLRFAELPPTLLPNLHKLGSIAKEKGCTVLQNSITAMGQDFRGYLTSSLKSIGTAAVVGVAAVGNAAGNGAATVGNAALSGAATVGDAASTGLKAGLNYFGIRFGARTPSPTPDSSSGPGSSAKPKKFEPVKGLFYETLETNMKGLNMPNNMDMRSVFNSVELECRFGLPGESTDKPVSTTPSDAAKDEDRVTTRETNASHLASTASLLFQRDTKDARIEFMEFLVDKYYDIIRKTSLISSENSTVKLVELVPFESVPSLLEPALKAMTVPLSFQAIWKCMGALIMKLALFDSAVLLDMPSRLFYSIDRQFVENVAGLAGEKCAKAGVKFKELLSKPWL